MTATGTLDDSRFQASMNALREVMIGKGMDASTLLQDQARLLIREIVKVTPPFGTGKSARDMGRQAISNDLHSLIQEVPPQLIDEYAAQFGLKNVETTRVLKSGKQVAISWDNIVQDEARLPELHNFYRKKNGRPGQRQSVEGQWRARIAVPIGMREPYIKKVQANVGRWKAKWALAGAAVGDEKYPAWVKAHYGYATKHTTIQPDFENRKGPQFTFGGRGPDFRRNLANVQAAFRRRAFKMHECARLILSGYAADIRQSVRPKRAKRTQEQPVAID